MIKKIQYELLKELPGFDAQLLMAPPVRNKIQQYPKNARQSAVSILLFKKEERVHTLFIKRAEDGRTHGGQIGFPGGKFDTKDRTLTYTALRECEEEIGISSDQLIVFGQLTPLYIPPSNFVVTPIVCYVPEMPSLNLSKEEVAGVFTIRLDDLFAPKNKSEKMVRQSDDPSKSMNTPIYHLQEDFIWGATAMILSELEEIYHRIASVPL